MKSFNDPVVRCVDCQHLIFRKEIQDVGMCPKCGTKRVKNVLLLTQKEANMLDWFFPDFVLCFDPKILGDKTTIWTRTWEVIDE